MHKFSQLSISRHLNGPWLRAGALASVASQAQAAIPSVHLPATLYADHNLQQSLANQSMLTGTVLGIVLCLVSALLVCGWALKSRQLEALGLLCVAALAQALLATGHATAWARDALAPWHPQLIAMGALVLATVSAWQVRVQLTLGSPRRKSDLFLRGLMLLNLTCMAAVGLGADARLAWIGAVSPVLSSALAFRWCLSARVSRTQRLLAVGYGVHAVAGAMVILAVAGLVRLPVHAWTLWTLEMLVFAVCQSAAILLSLVQTYRHTRQDREFMLQALEESERTLEQRVRERTQELQASRLELSHVLEQERMLRQEQRQFFNMISHEFRTPLTVVDSAATEQMAFPTEDLAEQRARAAQIRRACRRLVSLVDNCLISDRMDSEGFKLLPAPAQVHELMRDASQLVEWSTKHDLQLFLGAAPQQWSCDATLVRIALSNLADNAVKYADAGDIFVTAKKNEQGLLEFSVADSGPGMSLETLERVFGQFERGKRSDDTRGFGLGLWVSQRIAKLHGGDLTVESALGMGTCFTLTLAPALTHSSSREFT